VVISNDQKQLLTFARAILSESFNHSKPEPSDSWVKGLCQNVSLSQNEPTAVFVTLKNKNELRGCIGSLSPEKTLLLTLAKTTLQTAFSDPRFSPLQPTELNDINIEISLLSPMQSIKSIDEIKPQEHGVYLRSKKGNGLFLPQVWKQIPDKKDFIDELCMNKAKISPAMLQDPDTQMFVFTVVKINEESIK